GYYGFGSYASAGGFRPNSDELEKRAFIKADTRLTDRLRFNNSFGYSASKISEFDLPDLGLSMKRKVFSHYGSSGLSWNWNEKARSEFVYKFSERSFRRSIWVLPDYS